MPRVTATVLLSHRAPVLLTLSSGARGRRARGSRCAGLARLTQALRRACFEDPSLRLRVDEESGQTVLCGVGELHLSICLEKLERREGLSVKTGAPTGALRETIEREVTVALRHGFRPLPRGGGFVFTDETRGDAMPKPFVAAVEAGRRGAVK